MINFRLALESERFGVAFSLIMLCVFFMALRSYRKMRADLDFRKYTAEQRFGTRIALYLSAVFFLASLFIWKAVFAETGFDWKKSDAAEVELLTFSSAESKSSPKSVARYSDERSIGLLLEGLSKLKPYHSYHSHYVGKCYEVRLRHRSNQNWSRYEVILYADEQGSDGYHPGVYSLNLKVGSLFYGDYRARELGEAVETLLAKANSASPSDNEQIVKPMSSGR